MVGLSLVAVFAIAAIAATSASALPEWGKCVVQAKKEGKYTDSNCTKKAKKVAEKFTGEFEWIKGKELANVPFTGHSVGSGGLLKAIVRYCERKDGSLRRETRAKCAEEGGKEESSEELPAIECEAENSSGEATKSKNIANVKVVFTGCEYLGFAPCNSAGAASGEIKTEPLKGFLGYISKAKKEVGVVLEPVKKHGSFAKFDCGEIVDIVVGVGNGTEGAWYEPETTGGYDQVISPITPVNTMTSEYTQVYTTANEPPYGNVPHKLEGKHISALESTVQPVSVPEQHWDWGAAGEEITNVNTPAEVGEIKA
jgi:hypothetical protein